MNSGFRITLKFLPFLFDIINVQISLIRSLIFVYVDIILFFECHKVFLSPEVYLGPCQISVKDFFLIIFNLIYLLTVFTKNLHYKCLAGSLMYP